MDVIEMNEKIAVVIGGAGFIGCNLICELGKSYKEVYCIDDFSRGSSEYFDAVNCIDHVNIIKCDASDVSELSRAFGTIEVNEHHVEVWHLAANSDIPAGVDDVNVDLKDTFLTTVSILEVMKTHHFKTLFFASSSAIYGDHGSNPLHETMGPLSPISNYGAMKLSSEAIICAAYEAFLGTAIIFRFPNVVGFPATHGVIYDFVKKLNVSSSDLEVLGDGSQRKAYLHVSDLISAMLYIKNNDECKETPSVYNIGPVDDGVFVRDIAAIVAEAFGGPIKLNFGVGNKGWVGDVPKFIYSTDKLQKLGWKPLMSSTQAIERAASEIVKQLR